MIHPVGINTKQDNHEKNIFLGGWKAQEYQKGVLGCFREKHQKGEKFWFIQASMVDTVACSKIYEDYY